MLAIHKKVKAYSSLQKLQMLFICLFVCTLCLKQDVNHVFLIAALFVSLFLYDTELLKKNAILIASMILVYVMTLVSLTYTSNHKEGMFVLEKQMTLLIVPIIFGFSLKVTITDFKLVIYSFILSVFIACCYLLYLFLTRYMIVKDILPFQFFLNTQLHHQFSSALNLHATYFSIYVCFSIACSSYLLFKARSAYKIVAALFLIVFMISLVLLSSRIILIALFIITVCVLPFFLRKKALIIYGILFLSGCAVLFYAVSNISAFKDRFKTDTLRELNLKRGKDKLFTFENITTTNDATRAERWKCAVELIQEKPVLGYGTGDEKKRLEEKYVKYKLTNSSVNNFDAHNQYLAFMIKSGIFGLLAFLILLGQSFFIAIKTRNYYLLCFIIIISMTALTENVLESNKGILFFAFFNSFLICSRSLFPLSGNEIAGNPINPTSNS